MLFNIATRLKKPLAYGGLTVMVLYLLYKAILGLNIFSPLGEEKTFTLLNYITTRIFYLALVGVAFSALSFIIEWTRQTYVIKGNVQSIDGKPIKGAIVYVNGIEIRKETNPEGFFEIKVGKQESWVVIAQFKRRIAEKTVARKNVHEPMVITIGAAEKTDLRKSSQSHITRSEEYDRWYLELSNSKLTEVSPINSKEVDILSRTLKKVLKEKSFGPTTIARTEVVFNELINNVARHVKNGVSKVSFEINTSQLPFVDVSVADNGKGYDVIGVILDQALELKSGEREHGIGLVSRLSDTLFDLPGLGPPEKPWFTINCTLYDIPWPGSICDDYPWCGKVIIDYSKPASVWFGGDRYPVWWRVMFEGQWDTGVWGAKAALTYAINKDIQPIFDLYLEPLRASNPSYLFIETRNQGGTEQSPGSVEIILNALEIYFPEHFNQRKVLLYSLESLHFKSLETLASKYKLKVYKSDRTCIQQLDSLNKELHGQN